jgi:hypothetical protein
LFRVSTPHLPSVLDQIFFSVSSFRIPIISAWYFPLRLKIRINILLLVWLELCITLFWFSWISVCFEISFGSQRRFDYWLQFFLLFLLQLSYP